MQASSEPREIKRSIWPVPTLRLVLLIALLSPLAFLFPRHAWVVLVVDAAVLAIAWVDFLITRSVHKIVVRREFEPAMSLDKTAPIKWLVTNQMGRRVRLRFADAVMPSLGIDQTSFSASISSGETKSFSSTIRPARRGRFELQEIAVRIDGRLGLSGRQARFTLKDELKVYPSFASRRETQMRIENTRLLDEGARSVRSHGGGTDFDQLREYGQDDDFRFIDWAATARMDKPIVRTFRAERNQEVVVLLDTGRTMASRIDGLSRLDHAFDVTFALTTIAAHLGDRVSLLAFDSDVQAEVRGRPGKRQADSLAESLFQLEPRLVESDYRAAFVHTLMRHRRRALVVLITDLGVQSASGTLGDVLPLLQQTHKVIVAGVDDPQVGVWASAVPVEANKAFRKGAAIESLESRQRFKTLLAQRGVRVIDAAPRKLATSIVDTYLNIKATGSL